MFVEVFWVVEVEVVVICGFDGVMLRLFGVCGGFLVECFVFV